MTKKICDTCGGTGEIAFFQGVSRFLLSREECPMCHGVGYQLEEGKPEEDVEREGGQPDGNEPAGKEN